MWHLVSGGRKDEKFVHIPKVPSGDIYTFRFRGYRLHKKKCKDLALLAKKISRACEGEDIRLFSFEAAKWF